MIISKSFIVDLAKQGGKIAYSNLNKTKKISYKKKHEVVTDIDRKIEKFIVKEIKKKYPCHGFLGEEFNYGESDSDYVWVIDPIDGTNNYVRNFPHFCCSIAVLKKGEPIITAIYDPCKEQMFFSELNKGAYLNDKKIKVSETKLLKDAVVELSESDKSDKELSIIKVLTNKAYRLRIVGSTALSLCYVAAGFIDARVKLTVGKYDVAGGALLVREAGGVVTDFKGEVSGWERGGNYSNNRFTESIIDSIF